jgi:hypothetical protein
MLEARNGPMMECACQDDFRANIVICFQEILDTLSSSLWVIPKGKGSKLIITDALRDLQMLMSMNHADILTKQHFIYSE